MTSGSGGRRGRRCRSGRWSYPLLVDSLTSLTVARILSPLDLVRPADRQGIGLLDGPEIAGGRADVAVSEQQADGLQVARLAEDVRGAGASQGFGPLGPRIKTDTSCPGLHEAAQLPSRQRP